MIFRIKVQYSYLLNIHVEYALSLIPLSEVQNQLNIQSLQEYNPYNLKSFYLETHFINISFLGLL